MNLENIRDSIGLRFIVGLPSTQLKAPEKEFLDWLQPAGIFVTEWNFNSKLSYKEWLGTYSELIEQVRETVKRPNLAITIDHEGGRVLRVPAPFTRIPYAQSYGPVAAATGKAAAIEVRSLGVNCLLGPVCDVNSNPDNPVIGRRAFSGDPITTASCVTEYIKGVHSEGLACVAKHFPGHGDTKKDSHYELPVLDLSLRELEQRELVPFQAAIGAGVDGVMPGHLMIPELDSRFPSSLSSRVSDGLLRSELGFRGFTVSDDLDMKAIADNYPPAEIAKAGLSAGLDLLVFVHSHEHAGQVAIAMERAVLENQDLADKFEARNLDLLQLHANHFVKREVTQLPEEIFAAHARIFSDLPNVSA